MSEQSKQAVVNWFKQYEPNLYAVAVKRHALQNGNPAVYGLSGMQELEIEQMNGIGDFFTTLTETVKQVAEPIIAYKSQKDVLKAQLKRGEQGLPPLQVSDYSPVLRVSPSFTPESEAALTRMATETTGSIFQRYGVYMLGGVALLALLLRRKKS